MKKSELKQIIKEEIKAVLENDVNRDINDRFKAAMGFEKPTGGPGNRFRLPLEKLPTYDKLPETDEEAGPIKRMEYLDTFILLPEIPRKGGDSLIYSKEGAKRWIQAYRDMFQDEEPKFSYKMIPIANKNNIVKAEIVSDAYLKHQKDLEDFRNSPEEQENWSRGYEKLGYKGD